MQEEQKPAQVTRIRVGVYANGLTFGNRYDVLSWNRAKRQIKIRTDQNHMRWFPSYCFNMVGEDIPRLLRYTICDPIADSDHSAIEVEITLADGQRRWCFFMTPASIAHLGGEQALGDARLLLCNAPHLIIVSHLTAAVIQQTLAYLEQQGELLACTQPLA